MVKVGDVFVLEGFGQKLDEVVVLQVDKDWFLKKNQINGTIVNMKVGKPARYRLSQLCEDFNFKFVKNIGDITGMFKVLYGNE